MGKLAGRLRVSVAVFALGLAVLAGAPAVAAGTDPLGADAAMPRAESVVCGQRITHSIVLASNVICPTQDGLIVAGDGVTIDLNGHGIFGDGVSWDCDGFATPDLRIGLKVDGAADVTIKNGTVSGFELGINGRGDDLLVTDVQVEAECEGITLGVAQGSPLAVAHRMTVRDSSVEGAAIRAIGIYSGSGHRIVGSDVDAFDQHAGIQVYGVSSTRIESNHVIAGEFGIELLAASTTTTVISNTVTGNRDGVAGDYRTYDGIAVAQGSSDNVVQANRVSGTTQAPIPADPGVAAGIEVVESAQRNLIKDNIVSGNRGDGIAVGLPISDWSGTTDDNVVVGNTVWDSSSGIVVGTKARRTSVRANTVDANLLDGVRIDQPGMTATANVLRDNGGLGVSAVAGTIDGGQNVAFGNLSPAGQCLNVVCGVAPPGPAAYGRFVRAAYRDFLTRAPSGPELDAAVPPLTYGSTSRFAFVSSLASTPAWVSAIVTKLYQDTLGRPGDPGGVTFWADQIRSRRLTVAEVAARLYASQEYFDGIGGGTNRTWISDLYRKVLLRAADAEGLAYWSDQVAASGRTRVALRMYQSSESAHTRVKALYQKLLGRQPDAAGADFWAVRVVASGDLALAANLASSAEYFQRAQTTVTT